MNIPDDWAAEVVCYLKGRMDRRPPVVMEMQNWCVWHYRFGQNSTERFINSKVHALYFIKGGEDVRVVDLLTLGLQVPHVNLEIIEPGPEPSAITMRVHERGAGITQACGTGACVSAWAAAHWGLAAPHDGEILVHMDGGDARVRLHQPEQGHVTLVGPAVLIARLQIVVV